MSCWCSLVFSFRSLLELVLQIWCVGAAPWFGDVQVVGSFVLDPSFCKVSRIRGLSLGDKNHVFCDGTLFAITLLRSVRETLGFVVGAGVEQLVQNRSRVCLGGALC
ncbi:hypothetical protein M758_UG270400 [Ceratodon purpureus]|nr:hypothetical protein M758_UG270400 [Ceratodon purpureus]